MPLTYCLNVHPGESWPENLATLRSTVLRVRDLVSPGKPFGLGMRISAGASEELIQPEKLGELEEFLAAENLYVFTVNGFPYGRFHAGPVKESVYAPDWRSAERRDYTNRLATILASLTPKGMMGSLSTSPVSWKGWVKSPADLEVALEHLADCAAHCAGLAGQREIAIALEPEPGCTLETTEETVRFFENDLWREGARRLARKLDGDEADGREVMRRHIGVCFDTCHVALQFEDLSEGLARYRDAGVRVPKVQISSALRTDASAEALARLQPFVEPVYLHQVKARTRNGEILGWTDLPQALADIPETQATELRVHFHVPLHFAGSGPLQSTSAMITRQFLREISADPAAHLEIETYTWDVLPEELRQMEIAESIAAEFRWVTEKLPER
jgi:sugar phosphate isomerase/epimerase